MLLEEIIQNYWRNTTVLWDTIPLDRFITGTLFLPKPPCVALVHEKTEVLLYTNLRGPLQKTDLRFEIHYDSYEKAAEVALIVESTFDRLVLHNAAKTKSFLFRLTRSENLSSGENAWKFVRKFQVIDSPLPSTL